MDMRQDVRNDTIKVGRVRVSFSHFKRKRLPALCGDVYFPSDPPDTNLLWNMT